VGPPKLRDLRGNFAGLVRLMDCDVMIYLLNLVLTRADDFKSRCFSEDQVQRVLYLVAIGIAEQERMKQDKPEVDFKFTEKAAKIGLVTALEKLTNCSRIESHKELISWVLKRLKHALGILDPDTKTKGDTEEAAEEQDSDAKKKKAKAAAMRRAKIMQQMAAQQTNFMKENSRLFEETPTGFRDHKMSMCEWDMEVESGFPVCLGPNRSPATPMETMYTCILCQEEEELKSEGRTLVIASFIQKSTVLARRKKEGLEMKKEEFPYLSANLTSAPHTSSCGHVMHADCWKKYFDDVAETERKKYRSRHPATFDVDKSEFLCPLCRSLANSVITIIPQFHMLQQPRSSGLEDALSYATPPQQPRIEEVSLESPDEEEEGENRQENAEGDVRGAAPVHQQYEVMETTEDLRPVEAMEATSSDAVQERGEGDDEEDVINNAVEVIMARVFTHSTHQEDTDREMTPAHATSEPARDASSSPSVEPAVREGPPSPSPPRHIPSPARDVPSPSSPAPDRPPSLPVEPEMWVDSPAASTELGSSPRSTSSDSTFMSADESPKETFKDALVGSSSSNSDSNTSNANLSYSHWLEALSIALKYKKGLSPDANKNGGESDPQEEDGATSQPASLVRYYTCPLDQVVTEMEATHHDGGAFARLFVVAEGGELAFPTSVYEIMNTFCQTTYRIGLGELPHVLDELIPLMVWNSCAFTVISVVISAMDNNKPTLGSLSSRQNDCLSTLIRFCGVVGSNFGEPKVIRSHSLKLLSTILEVDTMNPSILELNMFGLLVSLTYSLPSLFNGEAAAPLPSSNIQDLHILRLLYTAHITQLLFSLDTLEGEIDFEFGGQEQDCQCILDMLHIVQEPHGRRSKETDPVRIWKKVLVNTLGFLRSCALFYQFLSGVDAPAELNAILPPHQEFSLLCRYLSLPTAPRNLLNSDFSLSLVRKWSNHPNVHIMLSEPAPQQLDFTLQVPSLIELTEDYSELINTVSCFTCPRALGDESRAPSMCLVCGEVVCSQSYCCQGELDGTAVGACTAHAHACGCGSGLFLRVRECKIIMLTGRTRGCFVSPPYLDQYGETDQGLKRGNPLTLCKERYKKLHQIWLNHGIPEAITHNLESATVFATTEWIHL